MIPAFRMPAVVALMLLSAGPVAAQDAGTSRPPPPATRATAQALVHDAMATANAQHRNVLVYFGASWCGPCRQFAAFLDDPDAGKLMRDNFVAVHLIVMEMDTTLDTPGAEAMFRAMGAGPQVGIPFYAVLDGTGRKIDDSLIMDGHRGNVGYPALPAEVAAFVKQLETVAPHMTAAERRRVGAYLTRMAHGD